MQKNVKNTTFPNLLDLLAPHSCRGCGRTGSIICSRCKKYILKLHQNLCPFCKAPSTHGICHHCQTITTNQNFPPSYTISQRSDLLDSLIHTLKYDSVRAAAKPLAELLSQSIPEFVGPVYLVPLPTITRHIRARGLDHTLLIAKHLTRMHPNYHIAKLLLRRNNTVQVGANATLRAKQAKSAYQINPRIHINKSATYILLDDVWTTGSSMRSAIKILQNNQVQSIKIAILAIST